MGRGMGTTTLQAKLIHNVCQDGGSPSHHFPLPLEVVLDPGLGPVPRHPVWIQRGNPYTPDLNEKLELFADCGEGWWIPPLSSPPWIPCGNPRLTFVLHGFQHGNGSRVLALGAGGGVYEGRSEGTWGYYQGVGVFLLRI